MTLTQSSIVSLPEPTLSLCCSLQLTSSLFGTTVINISRVNITIVSYVVKVVAKVSLKHVDQSDVVEVVIDNEVLTAYNQSFVPKK